MSKKLSWKIPKWKQSVSRVYADALKQYPESFSDPDNVIISAKYELLLIFF